METPEGNLKPQPTGGLKLMTVFVVVLALHVVVIGGMTAYYVVIKGGSSDTDMLGDKHKGALKANADGTLVADGTLPDSTDKTASPSTSAPDTTSTASTATPVPSNPSTPSPDQNVASDATPAPTPMLDATPTVTTPVASTPAPTPVLTSTTPVVVTTPAPTPAVTQLTTIAKTGTDSTAGSTSLTPPPDATTATTSAIPGMTTAPYVVVAGDSLAKIAHKNHTSVTHLMAANSMTSDKLSIGQKLVIPVKAPKPAELGTSVATAPGTDATSMASSVTPPADPAPAPVTEKKAKTVATTAKPAKTPAVKTAAAKPTKTPTKVVAEAHSYTIVKGDTLTKIAHKFKTTANALMAANNINDPTKLTIGKKLTIPKEAHTATTSTPSVVQPAQVETKKAAAQLATNGTNVIQ